jgi:hypothetical protein
MPLRLLATPVDIRTFSSREAFPQLPPAWALSVVAVAAVHVTQQLRLPQRAPTRLPSTVTEFHSPSLYITPVL